MPDKDLQRLYEEQKQLRRSDTLAVKRSQIKEIEELFEGLTSSQINNVIDSLKDIISEIKGLDNGYGYMSLALKGASKDIVELLSRLNKNELDDVLSYIKDILNFD